MAFGDFSAQDMTVGAMILRELSKFIKEEAKKVKDKE